jgi:hypothetical protein
LEGELNSMREVGKWLVGAGALLSVLGGVLWLTGGMRFWQRLGRLPGDLFWERDGTSVHIPLATCLILSVILSVGMTLLSWLFRR